MCRMDLAYSFLQEGSEELGGRVLERETMWVRSGRAVRRYIW